MIRNAHCFFGTFASAAIPNRMWNNFSQRSSPSSVNITDLALLLDRRYSPYRTADPSRVPGQPFPSAAFAGFAERQEQQRERRIVYFVFIVIHVSFTPFL